MSVSLRKIKKFNIMLPLLDSITSTIIGPSQSKLYSKLGFESLKFGRCCRKMSTVFKIKTTGKPEYLIDITSKTNHLHIQYLLVGRCYNALQQN